MNGHCVVDFEIINDALGCKIGLKPTSTPEGSSVRVLFGLSAVHTHVVSDLVESSCPVFARLGTDAYVDIIDANPVERPTWLT